ncbi:uncharacterized protein K452DRAFT_280562, partial [Aplosporella prunicola CBS 121167]
MTPQLSCTLCRDRKVKCDKNEPCTNCVAAGVTCVPIHRLRLPRGRHAHRSSAAVHVHHTHTTSTTTLDNHLSSRIHRLETLVQGLAKPDDAPDAAPAQAKAPSRAPQQPSQFWADLVHGIRELRGLVDVAEATDPPQIDAGLTILGFGGPSHRPSAPTVQAYRDKLCQVYLRQVDPIIKLLHRPSLTNWMLHGLPYLNYPPGHPSLEALGSAVCFSAASSMTENQCWTMFHTSRAGVVADCRRTCEAAIERSGLLATRDMTLLQAFVLYLASSISMVARRCEDRTRAVWTLLALAVRIAKSLFLYLDPDKSNGRSETFFEQQMRKRLWLTICLLDLQTSFGQASEPLIGLEEAVSTLALPSHVNDDDFGPETTLPVADKEDLTDTTFALVTYHAQLAGRLLNFGGHDDKIRQAHARRFESAALKLLHFCDPESSPYAWLTWHGTHCLVAGARLSALRPLQRPRSHSAATIQSARPSSISSSTESPASLLRLTLQALTKAHLIHTCPRGEPFRWYVTLPWHALAIALAEAYVLAGDAAGTSLVRAAWPLLQASYAHIVARHPTKGLRGPLEGLVNRVEERLAEGRDIGSNRLSADDLLSGTWSAGSEGIEGIFGTTAAAAAAAAPVTTSVQTTSQQHQQIWSPPSPLPDLALGSAFSSTSQAPLVPPTSGLLTAEPALLPAAQQEPMVDDGKDVSWQALDDFLVSMTSLDEGADADMFFFDGGLSGY